MQKNITFFDSLTAEGQLTQYWALEDTFINLTIMKVKNLTDASVLGVYVLGIRFMEHHTL